MLIASKLLSPASAERPPRGCGGERDGALRHLTQSRRLHQAREACACRHM